jgi:hypothetical protein
MLNVEEREKLMWRREVRAGTIARALAPWIRVG